MGSNMEKFKKISKYKLCVEEIFRSFVIFVFSFCLYKYLSIS